MPVDNFHFHKHRHPKAIGTRLALQISLTSAPILDFLSVLMRPLLIFLERLLPIITAKSELTTDEEEIRQMAQVLKGEPAQVFAQIVMDQVK